jgi:hypothetical protein
MVNRATLALAFAALTAASAQASVIIKFIVRSSGQGQIQGSVADKGFDSKV